MSAAKTTSKAKGRLGVTLFGGIFVLVGLGLIVIGPLETFYQHARSANWQPVPVTLHSVDVESHAGDDSTTYSVVAQYSYQFGGQRYQGDRVGYDWGSDNIGNYHQRIVGSIYRAQARGELRVWVNPSNPSESILMRELRWKKILFTFVFGAVFAGAGAGVIAFGWREGAYPSNGAEPIYSSERYGHWVLAFMAFMFIGISLPILFEIEGELRKDNWAVLLVLLFPVAGIGMGWGCYRMRRKWKYYGPLPLRLAPAPGQLGGDIAGEIALPKWYGDDNWQATLQCVRVHVSGGKNSRRSESVAWQQQQVPHAEMRANGSAIRFLFTPPPDLPASDNVGREQVEWRLILCGPQQPVPLERTYAIPVQQGSEKSTRPLPSEHVARSEKEAEIQAAAAASEQIDVQQFEDGLRVYSRVGRNLAMTTVLLVAGLGFAGGGVAMAIAAATEGFMLYLMAAIFILAGAPMFLGGLFVAGRSLEARIRGDQVESVRYWLGRPLWRRTAQLMRAEQLVLSSGGSSSSGHQTTEYLHIEVSHGGRKVRIAEGLAGRETAAALHASLIRLLRLP